MPNSSIKMSEIVRKHLWKKQMSDACMVAVVVLAVLLTFVQGAPSHPICTCGPGLVVKVPCGDYKDRVCEECPEHHFKLGRDETRQCQPCDDECPAKGMEVVKNCSSKNNLTCQCKKNSVRIGLNPVCECQKDHMAIFSSTANQWEYDCVPCPPGYHTLKPSLVQQCIKTTSVVTSSLNEHGKHSGPADVPTSVLLTAPLETTLPPVPSNNITEVNQGNTGFDTRWLSTLLILVVVIAGIIILRHKQKCCFSKTCSMPCCHKRSTTQQSAQRTISLSQLEDGTHRRQQGPDVTTAPPIELCSLNHSAAEVGASYGKSGQNAGLDAYEELQKAIQMTIDTIEKARSTNNLDKLKPVGVAIIDTGLKLDHPEVQPFCDRIKFKKNLFDGSDNVEDVHGHGTFIFGIFAQAFRRIPEAVEFYIIKGFSSTATFSEQDLEKASKEVLAFKSISVICIAGGFQGEPKSDSVVRAVNELCTRKTLIAAASNKGNRNNDQISYPGRASIAIGSADHNGCRSGFSPQGQGLFGLGFGENIRSINAKFETDDLSQGSHGDSDRDRIKRSPFVVHSGTSYATAWISVIAALVLYNQQLLFPESTFEFLRKTRYMRNLLKQMGRDSGFTREEGYGPLHPDKVFKDTAVFKLAVENAFR